PRESAFCVYVVYGGLLFYGPDVIDPHRRAANTSSRRGGRDFGQLTFLRLLRAPICSKRTNRAFSRLSAFWGKADIASAGTFRPLMTQSGHGLAAFAAMHGPDLLLYFP